MNNTKAEVERYLTKLIKGYSHSDKVEFTASINLDSLSLVSMIIDIETTFGFEFNDNDMNLDNFSSINKITNLILKTLDEQYD